MKYLNIIIIFALGIHSALAISESVREMSASRELTPEELDAAFTSEDAAREAAAFSDKVVVPDGGDAVQRMTASAGLVFRGTVTSQAVEYDANNTPFTRTTIAIDRILKGDYSGPEITLIQEGGPSKDGGKEIFLTSTTRFFNVGEEELLFVDLDPDNQAVQERVKVAQRFRIYRGKVYDEDGHGIVIASNTSGSERQLIPTSDRHPSKRFSEIHVGNTTLTKNFARGNSQPEADSGGDVLDKAMAAKKVHEASYIDSIDLSTFTAAIGKSE